MNRSQGLFAVAALSVLCASAARADSPDATPDVRCVIAGLKMGQVPGASAQTAGIMLMFYYIGRLDALSPKPDLEALIAREVGKMSPEELKLEVVRCGSEVTEKGRQLQAIGQHLVERGKQPELEEPQKKP